MNYTPRQIEVDARCPDSIVMMLVGIAEQCGKCQYWNATWRTIELLQQVEKRKHKAINEGIAAALVDGAL